MLIDAPLLGLLRCKAAMATVIALAVAFLGVPAFAQPAVPPDVSTAPADTVGAATRDVLSQVKGQKRVALVIGNSQYENVSRLPNPENDAGDMAATLKSLGFKVYHTHNVGKATMEMALADFSDEAVGADVALVFYAGHGIEVDRRNYLIPVDAKLDTDRHLLFETVALDYVLASLEGVKGVRIVLLDACRNNPFSASMEVSSATRSIGRGLSAVEASQGTLISFAAKEGAVADDGVGRNSPFTSALLTTLREPGVEIGILFRKVRDSVLSQTGGRQEPYVSASLPSKSIYIVPPPKIAASTSPQPTQAISSNSERAAKAWEAVSNMTSIAVLEAFREEFEGTVYSTFARARIAELNAEQGSPVPSGSPIETQPVQKLAALPAASEEQSQRAVDPRELNRLIQTELNRLGCYPGTSDGIWGRNSEGAVAQLNKHAKLDLEPAAPSMAMLSTLEAIDYQACPQGTANSATGPSAAIASRPAAKDYSKVVWQRIKLGERVSKMTPYGRLSCIGGSRKKNIKRQCHWD